MSDSSPIRTRNLRWRIWKLVQAIKQTSMACDLPENILKKRPRAWHIFRSDLASLGKKSERFAKAIEADRPKFESHYADNRKRLIAYAYEIGYLVDHESDESVFQFAQACLRANRKAIADACFQELSSRGVNRSTYTASATRRLARAAWAKGERDKALDLIRSVKGRVAREQYRSWLADSAVRNALCLLESGHPEGVEQVLAGALQIKGLPETQAGKLAAIYRIAAGDHNDSLQYAGRSAAQLTHFPRAILLSGFGWSGSGAIADFLKGSPDVDDVFKGREIGLWTAKFGLDRLYRHFTTKGFSRRILLEFLARHCFGHQLHAAAKGSRNGGGIWSMLAPEQYDLFLDLLHEWLLSVRQAGSNGEMLLGACRRFSTGILGLLAKERVRYVLLSNCITSESVAAVRMFESPVVIVSWRDPSDSFASKQAAFPESRLGMEGWSRQLKRRIAHYMDGKRESAHHAADWLEMSFEQFVLEPSTRAQLVDRLGIDAAAMENTFDPEVSKRNIGFHDREESGWQQLRSEVAQARKDAEIISPVPRPLENIE